jgi:hypothetical protein
LLRVLEGDVRRVPAHGERTIINVLRVASAHVWMRHASSAPRGIASPAAADGIALRA